MPKKIIASLSKLSLLGLLLPLPVSAHDADAGPIGQFFTSFPVEFYILLTVVAAAAWMLKFSRRPKNALAWSSLVLIAALAVWTVQQTNHAYAAITSISPNGGECIKGGANQNITWTSNDPTYNHGYLSYSADGGATYGTYQGNQGLNFIMHGSTSPYGWSTPSITNSTMRIYVESHDGGHGVLSFMLSANNFSLDNDLPTAPTASLTAKTSTTASLSWTTSTDAGCKGLSGYKVYRDGAGTPVATIPAGTTTYQDNNLTPSTSYVYVIKAYDDFGEAASGNVNVTTDPLGDTTPPAAITTLATSSPTASAVTLTWTSPGDDNGTGTAASYDIRYSTSTINDANFGAATQVSGEPTPVAAGASQNMTVSGLSASTTYFFAMKTQDEVPNISALSNVVSRTTNAPPDTTAPAAITNLAASPLSTSSMSVSWTAPGDDGSNGTAASYDLRYSTTTITSGNFASATQVSGEPTPSAVGTSQNMVISGLNAGTTYSFAMTTSDEVPNTSALSNVASGTTTAASSGGGTSAPLSVTLAAPNGGETLAAGSSYQVLWGTGGSGIQSMRLSLSTDSGVTYPTVISSNEQNDGLYAWTVPSTATTTARLKIEAISSNSTTLVQDTSNANFTITVPASTNTTTPPATTEPPSTTTPTTPAPTTPTPGPAPRVTVLSPNGKEAFASGTSIDSSWLIESDETISGVTVALSLDGGKSYSMLYSGASKASLRWTVPSFASTEALLKVTAKTASGASGSDTSDAVFAITSDGTAAVVARTVYTDTASAFPSGTNEPTQLTEAEKAAPLFDTNTTGSYTASDARAATPTIDVDKDILPPPPEVKLPCVGGSLIKLVDNPVVYYCGKNGKRYIFPNESIFRTWYTDFKSVKTMSPEDMSKVPIGGNITYKPGVKMIKIQTDPKTYAVARAGLLRWVKDEAVAARLYGSRWNRNIDVVADSFFFSYQIGDPIE